MRPTWSAALTSLAVVATAFAALLLYVVFRTDGDWALFFQLTVNVGMVMGVMPITGIPLPFVTHGGASLVSMAIGLGILQSINIRQTRAEW